MVVTRWMGNRRMCNGVARNYFVGTYTYTAADFRDTAQAIFDGKFGDFAWVEHRQLDSELRRSKTYKKVLSKQRRLC